ncbi:MAG: ABC transporter ATP-binding protein [Verrucomicrobiota bacterium]
MPHPVISVRNLSKQYRIGARRERYRTLRDVLSEAFAAPFRRLAAGRADLVRTTTIWALKDISFDVERGEVIGVIGRNGAGKSTLLKLLSEITYPTEGRVEIRGRVGSLLEVGTGFHPELTGRENIFLNGAILGMRRAEIRRKFDEIVAFAEVDKFIDTPVKRFSSGMYVRLAFAVAAHLEPEILLVDEVLAVGDVQFQKKCLGKMGEVAHEQGRTILFVSHNMAAIESLCPRALLLNEGRLVDTGETQQVISRYLDLGATGSCDADLSNHPRRVPGSRPIARRLRLTDARGATLNSVSLGEDVTFQLELFSDEPLRDVVIGIHFYNSLGLRVATCHSKHQYPGTIAVNGRAVVNCTWSRCALLPGPYTIVLGLAAGGENLDRIDPALSFEIAPRDFYGTGKLPGPRDGVIAADARWTVASPAGP